MIKIIHAEPDKKKKHSSERNVRHHSFRDPFECRRPSRLGDTLKNKKEGAAHCKRKKVIVYNEIIGPCCLAIRNKAKDDSQGTNCHQYKGYYFKVSGNGYLILHYLNIFGTISNILNWSLCLNNFWSAAKLSPELFFKNRDF